MVNVPITKRWPGHHCTRVKVWIPAADGLGYSSVEIETKLSKPVADLILQLLTKSSRFDPKTQDRIAELAAQLKEK